MKENTHGAAIQILLADDDADDCYFFAEACRELPFNTNLKTVSDGERLMSYLLKNTEDLPDMLFLDLNMPRNNGMECLRLIKQIEPLKQIPVVICSTTCDRHIAHKLYIEGAHFYLPKCDFSVLKKSINKVVSSLRKDLRQPPMSEFMLQLQHA